MLVGATCPVRHIARYLSTEIKQLEREAVLSCHPYASINTAEISLVVTSFITENFEWKRLFLMLITFAICGLLIYCLRGLVARVGDY